MQTYINDLVEIGLTELEARMYLTLLHKNAFTASELSVAARVNRTQTYDILSKLTQRGMILESRGKVKKYSAVNPKNVLGSLKEEFDRKKNTIAKLEEPLSKLFASDASSGSLDYIQVLSSRNNIINKIEKLEYASEKEILAFCKPPYMMNISYSHSKERADIFSNKTDFVQRSIYQAEYSDVERFINWIQIFKDAGEEVRICEELPIKFVIFDQEKVVCTINNKLHTLAQFSALFVDNVDLSKALTVTFYHFWEKALTLEQFIEKSKKMM